MEMSELVWLSSDVYMVDTDTCPGRTWIRQLRSCQHVFAADTEQGLVASQDHNWRLLETVLDGSLMGRAA